MKYMDFQKATIKRVIELYESGIQRVLVADEVGLGKTIIAQGIIKHLLENTKKSYKVVYICSNRIIADQNVQRLVNDKKIVSQNVRLSMQHLEIMRHGKESVIFPVTPDTSFNIMQKNSGGIVDERALMYVLLKLLLGKKYSNNYYRLLQMGVKNENWRYYINKYQHEIDEVNNNGKYLDKIRCVIQALLKVNNTDNFEEKLTNYLEAVLERNIAKWRLFFMQISLEFFQADFVIMDEFQRFSNVFWSKREDENSDTSLLVNLSQEKNKNSDTRLLVDKFLNNDSTKVLLLSATPYKIYSTVEEINDYNENPYHEFIKLVEFLNKDDKKFQFQTVWQKYSCSLNQKIINKTALLELKNRAEKELYNNICRTERNTIFNSEQILQKKYDVRTLKITSKDIECYVKLAQTLTSSKNSDSIYLPVDYIKSCPFLLSFIEGYQLQNKISKITKQLKNPLFWVNGNRVLQYEELKDNNAKFSEVKKILLSKEANKAQEINPELLLWVPPSLPYYKTNGVFSNTEHFSKTLIFSSWQMVPRMISTLISYEVERKTIGKLIKGKRDKKIKYSSKKRYIGGKLSNQENEIIALCYPSQYLMKIYSPLAYYNQPIDDIRAELKKKIENDINNKFSAYKYTHKKREDTIWYELAPILLDFDNINFFDENNKSDADKLTNRLNPFEKDKNFAKVLAKIVKLIKNTENIELGNMPADLADYLVDMAIGSPAVVMLRILNSLFNNEEKSQNFIFAMTTAYYLTNYLNLPESTAAINLTATLKDNHNGKKGKNKNNRKKFKDKSFVRKVLYYCQEGNLQAMLEEYIHILEYGNNIEKLCEMIISSMSLKTSSYQIKALEANNRELSIRTHYAVSFLAGNAEEKMDRKKMVKEVFNSPFRPFILTTTSIGQEGLDFHNYCRQIIHWNLPSNPIDLEQREGRVARYKNLAVRQNIAKRYGATINKDSKNIWNVLFEQAKETEYNENTSELVPYWRVKEINNDTIPVEQIILLYPFSRDRGLYERLIKLMATYRLSLGQVNQDELLESIMQNFEPDNLDDYFMNLSPYFRKSKKLKKQKNS